MDNPHTQKDDDIKYILYLQAEMEQQLEAERQYFEQLAEQQEHPITERELFIAIRENEREENEREKEKRKQ